MQVPRVGRMARFAGLLALASAVLLFGGSCTDEGKAKVKAAVSSIAGGGGPTPSQRPTPSGRPSQSPTETAEPVPSESSEATESPEQSPSEIETTEPPTTEPPTTEPSPTPSFSPSPVESSPTESPSATASESATESAAATESGSGTAWIWIILALLIVGGIVAWALWARARGQRAAAWRSRARDPFSAGVVLHDRVKADLGAPQVADDRLDESLADVDRIGQQLNGLTVDAPDDGLQQALAGLLMSLGAVRSALEEVRRAADPAARQSAVEPAQARVAEFERSLGSFRAAVWPQSTPEASS